MILSIEISLFESIFFKSTIMIIRYRNIFFLVRFWCITDKIPFWKSKKDCKKSVADFCIFSGSSVKQSFFFQFNLMKLCTNWVKEIFKEFKILGLSTSMF